MLYFHDSDKTVGSSEHFSEEETVCRICLIELGNGPETIKMECNCRGELALAHQECAIKWFSTKGNRICDVCRQEVRNLPATLPRAHSVQSYNFRGRGIQPADITQYRQVKLFPHWNVQASEIMISVLLKLCIQNCQILFDFPNYRKMNSVNFSVYVENWTFVWTFCRVWQDVPFLVIINMLAYFGFLEQLLVFLALLSPLFFLFLSIHISGSVTDWWLN